MSEKKVTFHESFSELLKNNLLYTFKEKSITKDVCLGIYQEIFSLVTQTLMEGKIELSNEGANYVAQLYYESIRINNTCELDPSIFTQEAKVENLSKKDCLIIFALLRHSPLLPMEIVAQLKG